jgi:hypothetical protein
MRPRFFFSPFLGAAALFIGAFFLMITTKLFKTPNSTYITALKVVIWPMILSTILEIILNGVTNTTITIDLSFLVLVISLVIILKKMKEYYQTGVWRSLLILIVNSIIEFVVIGIIVVIFIALFAGSFLQMNT